MKKKNLSSLVLRKKRISHLNFFNNFGGLGEPTTGASITNPNHPTNATCPETDACETVDPIKCQTTRTVAENTFEETCDCNGFVSLGC